MEHYQEYPKWVHFDDRESVLVEDETGELEALEAAKPKRGRPAKESD